MLGTCQLFGANGALASRRRLQSGRQGLQIRQNCNPQGKCSILTPAVSEDLSQPVRLDAGDPAGGSQASKEGRFSFGKTLFGLDADTLAALMVEAGEPAWRGSQIAEAVYRQRITNLSEITTLPKPLRQRLAAEGWEVGRPTIAQVFQSADGTERYLVQGQSGEGLTVETVWMPEGDDGETGDGSDPEVVDGAARRWQRATLCISSQVGCAVNCQFCLTAKLGFQRNLSAGEIAGQVLAVLDRHGVEVGRDRVNLVFMGMGEPFLNYDNFMAAVRLLVREVGLSPQRMTVSTSGIVPGIERFAQEPAELRPKLAISLNAPNNAIRGEIMPINRKWPIEAVIDAVRKVQLRPRERITFEYVLLGGVTDRPEDAREVARLVRRSGLPAKVNLIAWNPGPGIGYSLPQPEAVEAFRQTLADGGIATYVRKPRGRDIYAACGQLKRTMEG
jgi:23S rRNA (adenine2503-C2)-methyltransferase